jgi:hypothetical protein
MVAMLCVDPWRELLPSGSRTKENAMLMMKNFTQLDMVFIDGDPNMLPWHEEAEDLLQFVLQTLYAQEFTESTVLPPIPMFCTAVGTQCVQYLANVQKRQVGIFNGTVEGKGQRIVDTEWRKRVLDDIDRSQDAAQKGAFLDNATGDVWELQPVDRKKKGGKKKWEKAVNVGMLSHGSRNNPRGRYRPVPIVPQNRDAVKTLVCRLPRKSKHWILSGIKSFNFMAPVSRSWDLVLRAEHATLIDVIGESERGPELMEVGGNCICTQFSLEKSYPDTVALLKTFTQSKIDTMVLEPDVKKDWYDYMMRACTSENLTLTYMLEFPKYVAPKASYCMNPEPRLRAPTKLSASPKKAMTVEEGFRADNFTDADLAGNQHTPPPPISSAVIDNRGKGDASCCSVLGPHRRKLRVSASHTHTVCFRI